MNEALPSGSIDVASAGVGRCRRSGIARSASGVRDDDVAPRELALEKAGARVIPRFTRRDERLCLLHAIPADRVDRHDRAPAVGRSQAPTL